MKQIHANKHIEHIPSKPTTTNMRKMEQTNMRTHKQTNNNEVVIGFMRKREHERSI